MNDNKIQHKAQHAIEQHNSYYATLIENVAPAGCDGVSADQGDVAWSAKLPAGA